VSEDVKLRPFPLGEQLPNRRLVALRSRDVEIVLDELDDVELAGRASRGDADAFEVLYRRHAAAAWRVAQAVASSPEDAADAVSEAFTKLLAALATGRLSPVVPFRPYLLTSTRNAVMDHNRHHARVQPDPEAESSEPPSTSPGPSEHLMDAVDAALIAEAFRSLPERWRSVLWMSEVEGLATREVGNNMGLTPTGASQLAHRARNALRERYLQAHVRSGAPPACLETTRLLGAAAAGSLTGRSADLVAAHLAGCLDCQARAAELADVGASLRGIALPIPAALGALTLAKYQLAFAGARHARRGAVLVLGGTRATGMLARAVALSAAAVLVIGLITAGLMSSGNNPAPVKTHNGGSVAAGPPIVVTQLAAEASPTGDAPSRAVAEFGSTDGFGRGGPGQPFYPPAVSFCPDGCNFRESGPGTDKTPPGGSGNSALIQVALSTNLDLANASVAVGVGGGCTGISLDGSTSCAPLAPTTTGLDVGLDSPLGPISLDVPPESTTAVSTRADKRRSLLKAQIGGLTISV